MKINGTDTNTAYGVREWNVGWSYADLSNASEMPDGWITPYLTKTKIGLKTIKVSVMISGAYRDTIWRAASNFIAALLNPCEMQFDEFPDRYFYGVIKNASHTETCLRRWHKASVELVGFEYGTLQHATYTGTSISITNPGNIPSPIKIRVAAAADQTQLQVAGIVRDPFTGTDEPVYFNNLVATVGVTIDPEAGTVLNDSNVNKFESVEMLEFPSLKPGANTITLNRTGITTDIWYRPYYV